MTKNFALYLAVYTSTNTCNIMTRSGCGGKQATNPNFFRIVPSKSSYHDMRGDPSEFGEWQHPHDD